MSFRFGLYLDIFIFEPIYITGSFWIIEDILGKFQKNDL